MDRFKVLSTKHLEPSLVDRANKSGVDILQREFIAVRPIISDEVYQQLKPWFERTEPTDVVFTSANGVEAVKIYLEKEESVPAPNWQVYSISGKTKEAVTSILPNAPILATAENGVTLAQRILEKGGISEVVFFCGNKRREDLPALLKEARITVHEIIVYQTEETPSVVEEDLDAVLFFSPSGVQSFFAANQLKKEAVCFAIGRTTADAVVALTRNKIIISDAPSPEAMLTAVQHYIQTNNYKK